MVAIPIEDNSDKDLFNHFKLIRSLCLLMEREVINSKTKLNAGLIYYRPINSVGLKTSSFSIHNLNSLSLVISSS